MPNRLTSVTMVATFALVAGLGPTASAQMFIATGHDTLRGLPGVEVMVESLEPDLERDGLTRAAIQSDVERRLGAAGIPVYRSQTENPSLAKAYLYVQIDDVRLPGQDLYAVGVQVQLRQTLQSPVTASNIVDAMTWDEHTVVVAKAGEVARVRDTVQEYVDQFVRDWMAVH
jgi:hypothetical protein